IRALFVRLPWPSWTHTPVEHPFSATPGTISEPIAPALAFAAPEIQSNPETQTSAPITRRIGALPALVLRESERADARLVYVGQYPLTHRGVAQAFRRLPRPLRSGPATELDIGETWARRVRAGVAVPPALMAARRNTSRLLLLVDVEGSMEPYRPFVNSF